jgi:PPOX class probable F420-dependent enzyme
MATLEDPRVVELLEKPYYADISTHNADGSIHSTVVWVDLENGVPAVNSAVGRVWPTNLERDPRTTLLISNPTDPYEFLEVRGTAEGTTDGADEQIDRLAKKYLGVDSYPARRAGEQRIKFLIKPDRVRYVKSS